MVKAVDAGGPPHTAVLRCGADHLDLDRTVPREPGDTDRGARVPSVLSQHLEEEITGRIGDPTAHRARAYGHEDQHLHDPDPVRSPTACAATASALSAAWRAAPRVCTSSPGRRALAQQLTSCAVPEM